MKRVLVLLNALAAATPLQAHASQLEKRCRLGRAIMPCWVYWDHSECEAYVPPEVTYDINRMQRNMTGHGICDSCSRALAKEKTRDSSDNWATHFGTVEDIGNSTFVISGMEDYGLNFHAGLKRHPLGWGTSCVWEEGAP